MHGFSYKNGSLFCEDVDLSTLAAEHGTPLYVYSAATIIDHYKRLDAAMNGVEHEVAKCEPVRSHGQRRHLGFFKAHSSAYPKIEFVSTSWLIAWAAARPWPIGGT